MAVNDNQIKYVLQAFPTCSNSNTEFCIKFWEVACEKRNVEFPDGLKTIMREYKPEALCRKRREFTEPTEFQKEKEKAIHNTYAEGVVETTSDIPTGITDEEAEQFARVFGGEVVKAETSTVKEQMRQGGAPF